MNVVVKGSFVIVLLSNIYTSHAYAFDFTFFGDVIYTVSSDKAEPHSFAFEQVSFSNNEALSESSEITSEFVVTATDGEYRANVDRLAITTQYSNLLSVTLGRIHTPIGFWNTNFHHGSFIQDTVTRPLALEFEDSQQAILPTHMVGIHLNGEYKNWDYRFALANSNGIDTSGNIDFSKVGQLEVLDANDPSAPKSFMFRFAYKTEQWLEEIGVNFMFNNVTELGQFDANNIAVSSIRNLGDVLFDQQIVGLDLRVEREKWYVFSEYYLVNITDLLPNTDQLAYDANLFYAQFGWRQSSKMTYVFRVDDLKFNEIDNYYRLLGILPKTRYLLGLNYRFQESHGIHVEAYKVQAENATTNVTVQWYFALL